MLVQGSSFEIDMSMFNSYVLQEVGAILSWATCSNVKNRTSEHLTTPLFEHVDTNRAHAYFDTDISVRCTLLSTGFLPVGIQEHALKNAKIQYIEQHTYKNLRVT